MSNETITLTNLWKAIENFRASRPLSSTMLTPGRRTLGQVRLIPGGMFIAVLFLVNVASPLQAQQALGAGVFTDNPVCANGASTGTITCAAKGLDNSLYAIAFDTRKNYTSVLQLGYVFDGNFSCARTGSTDSVTCALKGTDDNLYGITFNVRLRTTTGVYLLPKPPGGPIAGTPSCASSSNANYDVTCAVRNSANQLYGIEFNPGLHTSSNYLSLGGTAVADISCADGENYVSCAVKGLDSKLYGIRFNAASSDNSGFKLLGKGSLTVTGTPSCATTGPTWEMRCAVRGVDNSLWGIYFDPQSTSSSAFQSLGGVLADDPSCVNSHVGQDDWLHCAVRGTNNAVYAISFDPSTGGTTGWASLTAAKAMVDNLSCASPEDFSGMRLCVYKGTDNSLFGLLDPR